MAAKQKHSFVLRQKPNTAWEILALDQDGNEFYYGNFSLKQNAVRWGDSHKNPEKFPRAVERDGLDEINSSYSPAPKTGFNKEFSYLCGVSEVNQSSCEEVSDFTGIPPELLVSFPNPDTGEISWQPNGSV